METARAAASNRNIAILASHDEATHGMPPYGVFESPGFGLRDPADLKVSLIAGPPGIQQLAMTRGKRGASVPVPDPKVFAALAGLGLETVEAGPGGGPCRG